MDKIRQIFEDEEICQALKENQDLLAESIVHTAMFKDVLEQYVVENISEFVEEDITTTAKNIRIFAAGATRTFIAEMSKHLGDSIENRQIDNIGENIEDFI